MELPGAIGSFVSQWFFFFFFFSRRNKKEILQLCVKKTTWQDKCQFKVIEGIDSGGEDGIHIFTKSDAMKEVMADTKLAKVSQIIDEVMFLGKQTK